MFSRCYFRSHRVQHIVRITLWVKISLSSIQTDGRFQHRYSHGTIDVTGPARKNSSIVRHLQERRYPGMLIIQACHNQEVGAIQPRHEAWPHGNPVRILNPGGQTFHINQLFADLPRNIRQIGEGRDDTYLLRKHRTGWQPTEHQTK